MKLTKYEHACFTVEKDGKVLVVDPGGYTTDLPALENVVAVIITHKHADHFDINAVEALFASNPDIVVYSPQQVDESLVAAAFSHKAVAAGETISCGPFELEFFGGDHAEIHASLPIDQNVAVMVNDTVYYPGDSFTQPNKPVAVLALPVAAPWLKMSEVIDYIAEVKPTMAFPTHDAILSSTGKKLSDTMLPGFMQIYGGTYKRIDSMTVDL